MFKSFRKKSPWILHYNSGSCNGCDIELLACLGPKFDIERFGAINTGNPKQSDILLVTGPVTKRAQKRLVEIWTQMPEPKVVIACGTCACTGGIFKNMYNVENGVDEHIPVDVYVSGCATHPKQIIDGVLKGLEILEHKSKEIESPKKLSGKIEKCQKQINRREITSDPEKANEKD
jgi:Ni,Fe-hydrogenase III small subunit